MQEFQEEEQSTIIKGFYKFRSESLASSALSEAMAYSRSDIKKAAIECEKLYQHNSGILIKFASLNKMVKLFGCKLGIVLYANYVKIRQCLHL